METLPRKAWEHRSLAYLRSYKYYYLCIYYVILHSSQQNMSAIYPTSFYAAIVIVSEPVATVCSEIDACRSGRREIFMLNADISFETECATILVYPIPRRIMKDFRFLWRIANSNDFVLVFSRTLTRTWNTLACVCVRSAISPRFVDRGLNRKSGTPRRKLDETQW